MNDVARQIRERLTDVHVLCSMLGLTMARGANAHRAMIVCPNHEDRTPSCSVRLAKDGTIACKCHSCGWSADALGLIAKVRAVDDFSEIVRQAAELANAPALADAVEHKAEPRDQPEGGSDETFHAIWTWMIENLSPLRVVSPHVAAYLDGRKIGADAEAVDVRGFPVPADSREFIPAMLAAFERKDLEQASVLRPGQDAIDWPSHPVVIPWPDRFGRIGFVQRRRIDQGARKYMSPRGRSPRAPYGVDILRAALLCHGPQAEIIITEGAFACLARRKIARHRDECAAVVGVYSASAPEVGLPLDLLNGRRVVLCLDSDKAGERAREKLVAALEPVASELMHERSTDGAVDPGDVLEAFA